MKCLGNVQVSYRCFMVLPLRRVATAKFFNKLETAIFRGSLIFFTYKQNMIINMFRDGLEIKICFIQIHISQIPLQINELESMKKVAGQHLRKHFILLFFQYRMRMIGFRKCKQSKDYCHLTEEEYYGCSVDFLRLYFLIDTNFWFIKRRNRLQQITILLC